jgi:hypothetical protein
MGDDPCSGGHGRGAGAIGLLSSDEAAFITAARPVVDGGYVAATRTRRAALRP